MNGLQLEQYMRYEPDAMLAPIQKMPLEILGKIFLYCLPYDHRLSRTAAPLVLCYVCSLWRALALSMSRLWVNIAFWTPLSNTGRMCYPIRYVSWWLSLSRSQLLDITFERGMILGHTQVFTEFLLDMGDYARCRHLDLFLTTDSAPALAYFVSLPPGSLRSLESLVLEGLDDEDFFTESDLPTPVSTITVFQESPRLQKLTTDLLDFTYHVEDGIYTYYRHVLPWRGLTHFQVTEFIEVHIFVAVLVECAALRFLRVSLDLSQETTERENYTFRPDVILSHLTEAYISVKDGLFFPPAMDIFYFPALTHFRFRHSQGKVGSYEYKRLDLFSWDESKHFLSQLRHLEQLTLVGYTGRAEQIKVLLQSTPKLTKLNLDISVHYPSLMQVLFPYPFTSNNTNNTTVSPIPFLADLELFLVALDLPVPLDQLHALIESGGAYPLRNLKIHTHVNYHLFRNQVMENFPAVSKINLQLCVPSWSARRHTDSSLINNRYTNTNYTMFDVNSH